MYTDNEMLDELRRVAATIDGPLSRPKFTAAKPRISAPAITARFGSWLAAMEAAGLPPAYAFGGMWRNCPVCGDRFRFEGGEKARKTCGRDACRVHLQGVTKFKGDAATKQAARSRARKKLTVDACVRCGAANSPENRLEVHHKDRNPYNNDDSNLEVLCRVCHNIEHAGDLAS